MGIVEIITIAMGAAWASGINLYAAVATLGILGATGHIVLPPGLEVLSHPWVIGAAVLMYCVEFFADKVPGVDTAWDTVHSFIRIPAGAVLAAAAVAEISPEAQIAALLVGGGLAATSHAVKAGARVLINASPEPFTNWGASLFEDVLVIGGVSLALLYPTAFLILFAVFLLLAVWVLPKIWRGVRMVFGRIADLLHGRRGAAGLRAPAGAAAWPFARPAGGGEGGRGAARLSAGADPPGERGG